MSCGVLAHGLYDVSTNEHTQLRVASNSRNDGHLRVGMFPYKIICCCVRSRYAYVGRHLPIVDGPAGQDNQPAPPELVDELEGGTAIGTEEMD